MLTLAKYTTTATRRATVAFQGLDRNAGAGEGWFAHQEGLSTRRHPYLSPAKADKVETFAGAQDVFIWDGVRIVASEGKLWYGEEAVCNVTAGPKQFAVINTGLVVWPDGLAVDLTDREVTCLAAQAVNRGTAQITTNSLTLLPESVYAETQLSFKSYDERVPWLWVYTAVAWDETAGWTLEGGQWLRADRCEGCYYIPQMAYSDLSGTYTAEYPTSRFSYSAPTGTVEPGNDLGFYGKVADVVESERTASSFYSLLTARIYWAQQAGQPLDKLFRAGDVVSVTGTPCGARDVEKRIIRAVDPDTNTLTFDPGTFLAGDAVRQLSEDVADDIGVKWTEGDTTRRYRVNDFEGKAGWYAVMDAEDTTLRVYDGDWRL